MRYAYSICAENLILTEIYVKFLRQHPKEMLMLGYLFRQCADRVPATRIRRATATMLISELGRRLVKLLETSLEGMVLKSSKRRGRVEEAQS